ncbi:LppM family (lipo)protein [Amycolatopsis japonica]
MLTKQKTGLVLVVLLALAMTAGCFRYRAAATIETSGTVSGSVIVAFGAELLDSARRMGTDPKAGQRRFLEANAASISSGKAEVRPYTGDDFSGFETTFSGVSTADFLKLLRHEESSGDSPDVLFLLDHRGSDFVFSAELEAARPDQLTLPPEAFRGVELQISLTFPGPVRESNGTVSGNTVTWRPDPAQHPRLHAIAGAVPEAPSAEVTEPGRSDDGVPRPAVLFTVAGALVLLAPVVWLLARRRTR